MGFPWQSWILTSEIIALFENGKPEYIKENYKHDVYTFDYSERPDKEINHPTVKPLSIVGDVISKTKGQSVLDLFLVKTNDIIHYLLNKEQYPENEIIHWNHIPFEERNSIKNGLVMHHTLLRNLKILFHNFHHL